MTDIALVKKGNLYDVDFLNGDFAHDDGMDSAIVMSLMIDKRANADEVSDPSFRRGWIGNEQNDDPTYQIGSKLWLRYQRRISRGTANALEADCLDATSWMVQDGLAKTVGASSTFDQEKIIVNLDFTLPNNDILTRSFQLWHNTFLGVN